MDVRLYSRRQSCVWCPTGDLPLDYKIPSNINCEIFTFRPLILRPQRFSLQIAFRFGQERNGERDGFWEDRL